MFYLTKAGLYTQVTNLRCRLGLGPDEYGLNMLDLCKNKGIKVSEHPFTTPGLRAMAQVGDDIYPDAVILNSARNHTEQNVDCAHECIHLSFHRNEPCNAFQCFETALPNQNKYLEWQANEGGAELLVPYKTLLPIIKKNFHCLKTYLDIYLLKEELIYRYNVTEAVITYRLESLKYEIEQYINGIPVTNLHILSYSSQLKKGIKIKSLNNIAMDDLSKDFEAKHCNTCQSTISLKDATYCSICGGKSFQWGDGKMKYLTKIKLNENNKAVRCPVCDNEDILPDGSFCHICGSELVNKCIDVDFYGNGCGALAAANARYCIYCGSETTFLHNGILMPWEEEIQKRAVQIPSAQLEDLNLIKKDWSSIVEAMGGAIRPSFRETVVEPNRDSCLCIVFSSQENYALGSRTTVLEELESYILGRYGKSLYFKTRLKNSSEQTNTVYISEKDIKNAINLDIALND